MSRGFTLIEILVAVAVVAVLAAIAQPIYKGYTDRARASRAVTDITMISAMVQAFARDAGGYPDSLAAVNMDGMRDPWGNAYQYLNLQTANGPGLARKNRSLVPINSDFDLYSMGPDGRSVGPLTAAASRDDIVRANDGRFIGLASDY